MKHLPITVAIGLSLLASGCAEPTVRTQDLDIWAGLPVAALDTQPLFARTAMIRTLADDGIELRNYASGRGFASCAGSESAVAAGAYVSAEAFSNCSSGWAGCNNIFRIGEGKVLAYTPTGNCATNSSVWPTARYMPAKAASGV
jgi:hypothetical protein